MSGVKLALVSGANRGIGLEVARSLARDGYRVLAGTRSLDAMGDVDGLDITPVELDVTDPESSSPSGRGRPTRSAPGGSRWRRSRT